MADLHDHDHDHGHDVNPWAALGVTALAGGCTILGGLALFFVKRFKPVPFSISMGFAAGVMIWVTMAELVGSALESTSKGLTSLVDPTDDSMTHAITGCGHLLGTACIGIGWLLGWIMSVGMNVLMRRFSNVATIQYDEDGRIMCTKDNIPTKDTLPTTTPDTMPSTNQNESTNEFPNPSTPSVSSVQMEAQVDLSRQPLHIDTRPFYDVKGRWMAPLALKDLLEHEDGTFSGWLLKREGNPTEEEYIRMKLTSEVFRTDQRSFIRVSIFTALALGIHNLPEGLATYTSYMSNPRLGLGMALAIAVHNIPEGIAVAVPCYFGTGSWWKALSLCIASAVAEPIGALIGIGISSIHKSELFDGILMALIGGFMLRVAIAELFLTGLKYDPNNMVMLKATAVGFSVMAISLALFEFIVGGHVH